MKEISAELYQPVDIVIDGKSALPNLFFAQIKGIFKGPQGETLSIPAFYNGDDKWIIRFSPVSLGNWYYEIQSTDVDCSEKSGMVIAAENRNKNIHGRLRCNDSCKHHFVYEDGTNHFMMAYECNWLFSLGLGDPQIKKVKALIAQIKQYHFNQVIMNVYAYDTWWSPGNASDADYGPPKEIIWEGSNDEPDHGRFNIGYMENLDRTIALLMKEGITAHLYLKVFNKMVKWPENYSVYDDLYFSYIIARYQAFPNIIWDFSKEGFYELDKDYLINRLNLIKNNDAYNHLTTVHDDRILYGRCADRLPVDFLTAQQHKAHYRHTDFYYFTLLETMKKDWPVLVAEFGYEHGPKGADDLTYKQGNSAEDLIGIAYDIIMAGGYITYYYTYTGWDIIDYSSIPKGYGYFKILYEFFTSVKWYAFTPYPDCNCAGCRCLARVGHEYIFFIDKVTNFGRRINLKQVLDEMGDRQYKMVWINIYTGERVETDIKHVATNSDDYMKELAILNVPFGETPALLYIAAGE